MTPNETTVEAPPAGTYALDPARTRIAFVTRHMFGLARVKGTFALESGTVTVGDPAEASSVEAEIRAASFSTRNPLRDVQVRSRLWLNTKQHPRISFRSDRVTHGDHEGRLSGTLRVRGHAAPLELVLTELTSDGSTLTIRAKGEVDRYAQGVTMMKGMAARTLTFEVTARATKV